MSDHQSETVRRCYACSAGLRASVRMKGRKECEELAHPGTLAQERARPRPTFHTLYILDAVDAILLFVSGVLPPTQRVMSATRGQTMHSLLRKRAGGTGLELRDLAGCFIPRRGRI